MSRDVSEFEVREPYILRAAAVSGEDLWCQPKEAVDDLPEHGVDAMADAAMRCMESVVRHLAVEERAAMGLIVGTTLGCLEVDREFDRSRRPAQGRFASPAAFSRTLPSTVAAEITVRFGITGPSLVLSAGDCSAAIALRRAAVWMDHFGLNHCAAGAVDWAGTGVGKREGCRAAVLLLGRAAEPSVGRLRIGAFVRPNLRAVWDESLDRLSAWVSEPSDMDLGGGVQLVRTHAPMPAAGR